MQVDQGLATIIVAVIGIIVPLYAYYIKRKTDKAVEAADRSQDLFAGYQNLTQTQREEFAAQRAEWEKRDLKKDDRINQLEKENARKDERIKTLETGQDKLLDKVAEMQDIINEHSKSLSKK